MLPDAASLTPIAPRWATLSWHMGPTFALPGAGDAILAHPAVRTGLGNPGPRDVRELLVAARSKRATIPAEEAARAIATNFLLFDAARRLRAISRLHPKASDLDAIETVLRWAARLKMELVRSQFRLVIETIEARLGRRVEELGGAGPRVLEDALLAACDGVDAFDPFRGSQVGGTGGTSAGRVAGPVGLQVDRVAVRWSKELASVPARRAASILAPDTRLTDISRRVFRWQLLIEPDARARAAAGSLPANVLGWLSWRYGWAEGASGLCIPHTLAEAVAGGKSSTPSRASREDRAMVRAAVQVARQAGIVGR